MKKILFAMVCFMTMVFVFSSCGSSETEKIERKLEEKVNENSWGFVKKCETLQLVIDTLRVSDIKDFITKSFPEEYFPNGIPADFSDKDFSKFISPLQNHANLDDIVYLAVTYKHKSIFAKDFIGRTNMVVTENWLIDPVTYDYIMDDLRVDDSWTAPQEYLLYKSMNDYVF